MQSSCQGTQGWFEVELHDTEEGSGVCGCDGMESNENEYYLERFVYCIVRRNVAASRHVTRTVRLKDAYS